MRGSIFFKQLYKVRGSINSEHHINVFVDVKDIDILGEQQAVGHAAWLELTGNEKDEWGNDLGRPKPTALVMRKLCNAVGVKEVKEKFVNSLIFERLDNDEAH